MQISVIGVGYVGLVTGACLAEAGHEVVCTDKDESKISQLNAGQIPIYELYLDQLVAKNRQEGRLKFTTDAAEAVRSGEAVFICVGTPPLENGGADLSAIDSVARLIGTQAQTPKLVVEKSTVPVQTGRQLKQALAVYGRTSGVAFRVASNPEFLREGTAVEDFLHPDRIVVGVDDEVAEKQLRDIYQPILDGKFNCPVHESACPPQEPPYFLVTNINSAELIKHASNSFLALKISYANAISDLCELLGASVEEVTRAMGLDPRIGPKFLAAGLGFGGFCLPKDVQAFIRLADQAGMDFALLKEAERINKRRIHHFVEKIQQVPAVENQRPCHRAMNPLPVELGELRPLCRNQHRVRVPGHVIRVFAVADFRKQLPRSLHGCRVIGTDVRPFREQLIDQIDGRRKSDIVGVGFEGQAQHADSLVLNHP